MNKSRKNEHTLLRCTNIRHLKSFNMKRLTLYILFLVELQSSLPVKRVIYAHGGY